MDKIVAKHLFRDAGLPVARDAVVRRGPVRSDVVHSLLERLGPRLVVKPARQGSSFGVGFASDPVTLELALEAAFARIAKTVRRLLPRSSFQRAETA